MKVNTPEQVHPISELLNNGLSDLNYARKLFGFPVAEKIAAAQLGTMHTIAYKSISKDVPGLVVYKKIRLQLTNYEAQKEVKEMRKAGIERKVKTDYRVFFKNGLAYNAKTEKCTFSFAPMEKLQEKFVFNGFEITREKAQTLIARARVGKTVRPAPRIPWKTVYLDSIISFR